MELEVEDVAEPSPAAPGEENQELGDFEEGAALTARDCVVWQEDQTVVLDYLLGALEVTIGQGDLCAVISIAELHGKLLVAVPEDVWHRTVARRKLPSRTLSKAVLVAVAACPKQQRNHEEDIVKQLKIWVGLLEPEMEAELNFTEEDGLTYHFGSANGDYLVPYAHALVEVASEHFAFASAESEVLLLRNARKATRTTVENRLDKLEETLGSIAESLASMTGGGDPSSKAAASSQAVPVGKTKQAQIKKVRGLDAASVQAAVEAGIPMSHLEEMGRILRAKPSNLEDVPRRKQANTSAAPSSQRKT